ncbi:MAG: hypothetical protein J5631_00150 [Spirochaetaceae bacterium]|nr:hypothetical protein [Spirochaetaceae bacterium]
MRSIHIKRILGFLKDNNFQFEYFGDENNVFLNGFCNISEINDNNIAWVKNKKYLTDSVLVSLKNHSTVIIVAPWRIEGVENCLITENPKEIYFSILNNFFKEDFQHVISNRATVESDKIGENVCIAAGCYVCKDAEIGDNVILHANVVIDCPCKIGNGTEIFAGTVIGADGFGYYYHNNIPERVPHFGGVIIGENVDIGANSCVDRGTLSDTIIGNNVKIDNLCHIGHNVKIGNNTMIVAGSTICGSVEIGDNSYIAPEATIKNQVSVGEKSFIGMNTILSKSIEPMSMAIDMKQNAQVLKNKDYRKFI